MKRLFFLVFIAALATGVVAFFHGKASPDQAFTGMTWSRIYPTIQPLCTSGKFDIPYFVAETSDFSGYAVIGDTNSNSSSDCGFDLMAQKFDTKGDVQWSYTYGTGYGEGDTVAAKTPDGGYILSGIVNPAVFAFGGTDAFVLKLDENGNIQWYRGYGTSSDDYINSIQPTYDPSSGFHTGYILAGFIRDNATFQSKVILARLAPNGTILWSGGAEPLPLVRTIDIGFGGVSSVTQTADGGFILSGWIGTAPREGDALWVARLDEQLDIQFSYKYGPVSRVREVHEIQEGGSSYFMVAAEADDGSKPFIRVLKLNTSGSVVWENRYEETTSGIDHYSAPGSITPTSDGNFIVAANSLCLATEVCPDLHILLLKLAAADGQIIWQKAYGGEFNADYASYIQQTSDTGYVIAAMTNSYGHNDSWILKIDNSGDIPYCSLTSETRRTPILNTPSESGPDSTNLEMAFSTVEGCLGTDPKCLQRKPRLLSNLIQCPGSLDSDRDGVLNDIDNSPNTYNPDQKDSDGDSVGDVNDNCPDIYNPDQADLDGDGIGDGCETINESVNLSSASIQAGEPIIVTATFVNDTGAAITTIKPDCYNTSFVLRSSGGQTLFPSCRYPKPYGIGPPGNPDSDLIVIQPKVSGVPGSGEFSVTCNLTEAEDTMFRPQDLSADTYTVHATYANYIQDPDLAGGTCASLPEPCYSLWRGSVTATAATVSVGGPGNIVSAEVIYEPAVWNTDWATTSGQRIKATIKGIDPATVDPTTVRLNGSVPMILDIDEWWSIQTEPNALIVEFDGPSALLTLGTLILGGSYQPSVYGKIGENTYFLAKGSVTLQDRDPILIVQVDKHIVGSGTYPKPSKTPLGGVPVRLYNKAKGSCVEQKGISWQNYQAIWNQCAYDFAAEAESNFQNGQAIFSIVPAGNYLAIGRYKGPTADGTGTETIYIGVSVGTLPDTSVVMKYLQVIQNYKNQNVPGKYTKITGSDLLIIEPEYVEWGDQSEPYPFIFDSLGEWTITTSVSPPEGFVADYSSLSTQVVSELKALQFTVTDMGSKWVPTKVKHKIKHNGKTRTIESSVGVKLKPELAKSKGVSTSGDKGK